MPSGDGLFRVGLFRAVSGLVLFLCPGFLRFVRGKEDGAVLVGFALGGVLQVVGHEDHDALRRFAFAVLHGDEDPVVFVKIDPVREVDF